jgi:hypothetical protein
MLTNPEVQIAQFLKLNVGYLMLEESISKGIDLLWHQRAHHCSTPHGRNTMVVVDRTL